MRETQPRARREPSRTCVGCHAPLVRGSADEVPSFRLVLGLAEGVGDGARHEVGVDLAGSSFGRGAHVHASAACIAKACGGGLSKAFRRQVTADAEALARDVALAADRRIEGLLLNARRRGLLAFGEEARSTSDAPLVVVACDAGGTALGGPLRQAVAEGRVLVWRSKAELGALFSRELVALVAVNNASVAREIRRAKTLAEGASFAGTATG
jgi:predicted RNA-binding protein YlxR (DUF448 family)